jgi:hypothetical protein
MVDADFERLQSILVSHDCLFMTDYANLPVATITHEWLKSYFIKAYGYLLSEQCWQFMLTVLRFCFMARYVSATSEQPRTAPLPADFLSFKKGDWLFDKETYVSHMFGVSKFQVGEILSNIEATHVDEDDCRHYMNSNDVFDTVYGVLRVSKVIAASVPREAVRQGLLGAADDVLLLAGASQAAGWVQAAR